ncbi:MAG: DNRLRE domain-containing protein [Opitutaceae bacterium]|jgi:hypothetical protein|nr:DNRLRE domain-containing protein [Opitutaceae bacterium]
MNTKHIVRLILASFAALLFTAAARPDIFPFREGVNGYAGTSDSYIRSETATNNYGSSTTLVTRYSSNSSAPSGAHDRERENRVTLVRFDDLNLTGTVESASLTLTVANINSGSGGSTTIRFLAYEVLSPWAESGATWTVADTGSSWQTAGAKGSADRNPDAFFTSSTWSINSDTPTLAAGDTITLSLPASLVQSWIDNPSKNYGILLGIGATSQYRYPEVSFHSSEAADANLRPLLTLEGDLAAIPVPEPSTVALLAGAICCIATFAIRRIRSID